MSFPKGTAFTRPGSGWINYSDTNGNERVSGGDYLNNNGKWYLFTNYWFAYAFALKSGFSQITKMEA